MNNIKDTTTTAEYQIKPDFYNSQEEVDISRKTSVNTNPRYRRFNQTHYTAGDEEQFERYRGKGDMKNTEYETPNPLITSIFHKYLNADSNTVLNTFRYIFYKFKKGIFIKIQNGQLISFLPFSNKNFINEWSHLIHISPKYKNMYHFFSEINRLGGYKARPKFNKNVDSWYANNYLLRSEYPPNEGDTNNNMMKDMLLELCSMREVKDVEFFINRRDFPLLKRNGTEPYDELLPNTKLLSHDYKSYSPILSMVKHKHFADIPIPTAEDWVRVNPTKFFPGGRKTVMNQIDWIEKKPIAVFRGSATGKGIGINTNPRLKAAYLSLLSPDRLNAGITDWNIRPRKLNTGKYLQVISPNTLPFKLSSTLTFQEQLEYKYLLNIPGHVAAFRLSSELGSGSCVLLVDSPYKLWYMSMIKPYQHYIPVKADLSDLLTQIDWCRNHDDKCRQIAINAREFYDQHLCKDAILDHLQKVIHDISTLMPNYSYVDHCQNQVEEEREKMIYITTSCIDEEKNNEKNNESNLLFLNNKSKITLHNVSGKLIIKKEVVDDYYIFENIHNTFIGLHLNGLNNFPVTLGMDTKNNSYAEYIQGISLDEYIRSDQFDFGILLTILMKVTKSIQIAQKYCHFMHNDLTPWNILLRKDFSPVIIDFGKSSCNINDKVYSYRGEPCEFHTFYDLFVLIVIVLKLVIKKGSFDKSKLLHLSNYISFLKGSPFRLSGKNGMNDVLFHIRRYYTFDNLQLFNKGRLNHLNPADFIEHLKKLVN